MKMEIGSELCPAEAAARGPHGIHGRDSYLLFSVCVNRGSQPSGGEMPTCGMIDLAKSRRQAAYIPNKRQSL